MRRKCGNAIRRQRQYLGKSQTWLAEQVGVDQTAVSAWERGTKFPDVDKHVAIARALGIDANLIFAYPEAA